MRSTIILPSHIATRSISESEIILPFTDALEAINFIESKYVEILGREGLVKTASGRIGHGNAPQGTASLEKLTIQAAAQLCRSTMKEAQISWAQENAGTTDELYFCITVRA